jgi:PKD repeat protein
LDIESNGDGKELIKNTATVSCDEHARESNSMELPIFPTANTGTDTNSGFDNISAEVLPVANFSTNITSGYVPLSILFTDLSQNAASRSWDFKNDGIADSSDLSPFHTYTAPGIYTANMTVSNANGTASKNATISVLQVTSSSSGNSGSSSAVSCSTGKTNATETVIQPENNTQGLEQNNGKTANVEQTPEQKNNTSTPAKESKRTPGFGIICEITTLLAVFLYKRK